MNIEKQTHVIDFLDELTGDKDGYIGFGIISRFLLGDDVTRTSYYIKGDKELHIPNLGDGLRIRGNVRHPSQISIHKDDVVEFVIRILEYKDELPISLSIEGKRILQECRHAIINKV